jgi:hypothetical protein
MRTAAFFEHAGFKVHIYKYERKSPHSKTYLYRARVDGTELPVSWPSATELKAAIRTLLEQK